MIRLIRVSLILLACGYYVGCNKVKFEKDASQDPCLAAPTKCTYINGRSNWSETITPALGKVDIIIVDDNSGSMSFEQSRMAQRFANFIGSLKQVDFRIAITTTDISDSKNPARSINGNGALQDGKLIKFGNGKFFLSPSDGANAQTLFSEQVQRPETSKCEAFIKSNPAVIAGSSQYNENCPSGDERGIYAANLVVKNNPESFIRPEAHLAIVILSDEDTRSSNYWKSNQFSLDKNDLPQTLIDNVKAMYPSKTLSVHSIIVRPGTNQAASTDQLNAILSDLTYDPQTAGFNPLTYFSNDPAELTNSNSCINQQSSQISGAGFSGSYGYLYAHLSRMTGGLEGDICANDYASQLTNMGASIAERVTEVQLRCAELRDLKVVLVPDTGAITYSAVGSTLKFSDIIPPGTQVTLSYSCPSN